MNLTILVALAGVAGTVLGATIAVVGTFASARATRLSAFHQAFWSKRFETYMKVTHATVVLLADFDLKDEEVRENGLTAGEFMEDFPEARIVCSLPVERELDELIVAYNQWWVAKMGVISMDPDDLPNDAPPDIYERCVEVEEGQRKELTRRCSLVTKMMQIELTVPSISILDSRVIGLLTWRASRVRYVHNLFTTSFSDEKRRPGW